MDFPGEQLRSPARGVRNDTATVDGTSWHSDPQKPLLYCGEGPDEWFNWLNDSYFSLRLERKQVPQYILIAGSPQQVPFHFQSLLDTVANVGRVDFDTTDDLEQYVNKLIRIHPLSPECREWSSAEAYGLLCQSEPVRPNRVPSDAQQRVAESVQRVV